MRRIMIRGSSGILGRSEEGYEGEEGGKEENIEEMKKDKYKGKGKEGKKGLGKGGGEEKRMRGKKGENRNIGRR